MSRTLHSPIQHRTLYVEVPAIKLQFPCHHYSNKYVKSAIHRKGLPFSSEGKSLMIALVKIGLALDQEENVRAHMLHGFILLEQQRFNGTVVSFFISRAFPFGLLWLTRQRVRRWLEHCSGSCLGNISTTRRVGIAEQ